MARLVWHGDRIRAKVAAAAALALDRTHAECVADAKANHPDFPPASAPYTRFANRTAFTVGSIQIVEPATLQGDTVKGQWGAKANDALFLEIGTSVEGPTAPERAASALGDMDLIPPPVGPLMAPRPFLRPAADREYPLLARRMAAAFQGTEMP